MKKFVIVLISLILLFLLAYYIKSQLRINVFESISFSKYYPFKYLQADSSVVVNPQAGDLLRDTFELPLWSNSKWNDLWAREKDLVESVYSTDGVDTQSAF